MTHPEQPVRDEPLPDEPLPDELAPDELVPDQLLPCGRTVGGILDQVADGRADERDEHQQRCPHCQAALSEYQRLWAPVLEVAAQRIRAPEGLQESVMRRIRGVVENIDYGVIDSPRGITRISARVIVVTARETAESVAGVRVALSKPATDHSGTAEAAGGVTAGVAGRSIALEITLAVDYGQDLIALADRVRRVVSSRIRAVTDLDPVAITVVIDDILT